MMALQGWWLASRRTYREGCSRVRACAGKAGRQVLHIRPPLNGMFLESDHSESGSVQSGIHFRLVNWPRSE